MLKNILKTGVTVEQRPVSVSYTCPCCNEEMEVDYDIFCNEIGDNPGDWTYSTLECKECGRWR